MSGSSPSSDIESMHQFPLVGLPEQSPAKASDSVLVPDADEYVTIRLNLSKFHSFSVPELFTVKLITLEPEDAVIERTWMFVFSIEFSTSEISDDAFVIRTVSSAIPGIISITYTRVNITIPPDIATLKPNLGYLQRDQVEST